MGLPLLPINQIPLAGPTSALYAQQYDFKDFTYPVDLGSQINSNGDSLFGHWVTFFINQSANTQFSTNVPALPVGVSPNNPIATVVAPFNNTTQSQLNQNNPSGVNQTVNTRNTTRVPLAISLYMPPQISTNYRAEWENQELGFVGNLAQAWQTGKSTSSIVAALKQAGGAAIQQVSKDVLAAADAFTDSLGAGSVQGTASGALRLALNPHAETLFRGIGFRSFQFDFQFTPRTEAEAVACENIIQAFTFYAAPEINTGVSGPFWIFPAEFDIQFYSNGKPNNYLRKISTCALTNINVNYTADGMFSSFYPGRTLNGVTTKTNLTLNFVELEIIHKNRILQGY